jgi:hypothetical protein
LTGKHKQQSNRRAKENADYKKQMKTTAKEKQTNENAEAGEAGEEKKKRETTREKQ